MPTDICRHIKTNGVRCKSPALTGKPRCFFHQRLHGHEQAAARRRDHNRETVLHPLNPGANYDQRDPQKALYGEYFRQPPLQLDFPALEDRHAIQLALSILLSALGRNEIDNKRAGMMLYGLQVASSNAKTLAPSKGESISETVVDDTGNELAPDEDPEEEVGSLVRWLSRVTEDEVPKNQESTRNSLKFQESPATHTENQDFTDAPGVGSSHPGLSPGQP